MVFPFSVLFMVDIMKCFEKLGKGRERLFWFKNIQKLLFNNQVTSSEISNLQKYNFYDVELFKATVKGSCLFFHHFMY